MEVRWGLALRSSIDHDKSGDELADEERAGAGSRDISVDFLAGFAQTVTPSPAYDRRAAVLWNRWKPSFLSSLPLKHGRRPPALLPCRHWLPAHR